MNAIKYSITEYPNERRRFLVRSVTVIGAIGTSAFLTPFISYMTPSARARSAGAPVQFDFGKLIPGRQVTLSWRGKPVWVLYRTTNMLKLLNQDKLLNKLSDPASNVKSQQPEYIKDTYRSIRPEIFVAIGLCTHLGCIPNYRPEEGAEDLGAEWPGGYFCPCHGSRFDLAGRVYKGVPAPINLLIPPYQYLSDNIIEIGTNLQHKTVTTTT